MPIGSQKPQLLKILKEVGLIQRLKHDNIVEYKHCWIEDRQINMFGPSVPCIFVLMELASGGNLEEFIYITINSPKNTTRNINKTLHQDLNAENTRQFGGILIEDGRKTRYLNAVQINKLMHDTSLGLEHLHSHGIIHCDLKPCNLLLQYHDENKLGIPRVLISDFGESINYRDSEVGRTGCTGTIEFTAPELLLDNNKGEYLACHDYQTDMWSLGIILYFLCYSKLPFTQLENIDQLRNEILNFQLKQSKLDQTLRVDSVFVELLFGLLEPKGSRPSCKQVLKRLDNSGIPMVENLTVARYSQNDHAIIPKPFEMNNSNEYQEFEEFGEYEFGDGESIVKRTFERFDHAHHDCPLQYNNLKALEYPSKPPPPTIPPPSSLSKFLITNLNIIVLVTAHVPMMVGTEKMGVGVQSGVLAAAVVVMAAKSRFGYSIWTGIVAACYTGLIIAVTMSRL